MLDGRSLYDIAVERIRYYARPDGKNLVAFSGGKDSQCVYHLCKDAGITFTAQYSVTRFEPPELMAFIREHYSDVVWRRAYQRSLVRDIEACGLPSRWMRWCCDAKHRKTEGFDMAFIGVRGEESPRRRETWRTFGRKGDGTCYCCPIFEWTTNEVWEFLNARKIPHCRLYDEGNSRIGCIMCPLANQAQRMQDARRYPRHVAMLRKGADLFVERMRKAGFVTKRGRPCPDWCRAKNPEEEHFHRWLVSAQTSMPVEGWKETSRDVVGQCVFWGSGFSEKDGAWEMGI